MEAWHSCPPRHALVASKQASCVPHPAINNSLDEEPLCRYCWGSEGDEALVAPCGCSGTSKHVHYKCLVRWVSAGLASRRKQATPLAHCELCQKRFFNSSPSSHNLLLETAHTELQLSQLYSAAQQEGDIFASALSRDAPTGSLDGSLTWYWRVALRPLQAAMLVQALLHPAAQLDGCFPGHRALWLAGAGAAHAASWFAGRLCEQWVRAYASVGRYASAAFASLMFALGAGGNLHGWLQGAPAGAAAFHLRLPISLPYYPQIATLLAAVGGLFPGRYAGADGMRAAALAPLLAIKWAVEAGSKRGWLLGALCRLLTQASRHLRAAITPSPAA